ncbi:MAG: PAS domain S-box protein [Actinomycetota bacterium]
MPVRDATERKQAEAAIHESEERFRAVAETAVDAIISADSAGVVTYLNRGAEAMFGYSREEINGRPLTVLMPERFQQAHRRGFARYLASREPHVIGRTLELAGVRKDGSEFPVEVSLASWGSGEEIYFTGILRDLTGRQRARDQVEAANEVALAILGNEEVDEVLRIIARRSRMLADASVATVVTPEPGDGGLIVRVVEGEHQAEIEGTRFPVTGSISGEVMASRETVSLSDLSSDPRVHQPIVRSASVGAALFVPLAVSDRVFGTLLVGRPLGAPSFTAEERAVIELFASQAAIALEHARFQEELHRLAVLEDRERIGRELHDGAIQALFATGMKLQSLMTMGDGEVNKRVEEGVAEIDRVIRDLRDYIFGLRPGVARRRGTAEALNELAKELEDSYGVTAVLDVDAEVAETVERTDELVQLVHEALSNVGRHARAKTCRLLLGRAGEGVILEIDDDAEGFDPDRAFGTGQGLPNLRERAEALGARLEIDSGRGRGTTVRVILPG